MNKPLPVLLAVAASAALAAPAYTAVTRTINVGDDYFVKEGKAPTVTVAAKTRVRWRWVGDSLHNVTVTSAPRGAPKFKSRDMTSGSYSKVVTRRGAYKLICTIHGSQQTMTLRVK